MTSYTENRNRLKLNDYISELIIIGNNVKNYKHQHLWPYDTYLFLLLLFPSACTLRRRGETQMSVGCQASGL